MHGIERKASAGRESSMAPRVLTESGFVRGQTIGASHRFQAVPYAAPPFGDRRFLPPAPAEKWDGTRDATQPGVAAPQPAPAKGDPWAPMYAPSSTGTDCLTLDIWTPDLGDARLPVVMHIHGGGYLSGTGSAPVYSGRAFARDGVVHVSINYRLGLEGFLYLGEGHDNLGLRDQLAALQWVQRNIARFGGDPDQVTIMGQSAGAVSVLTQLAMPDSAGLFQRAIAQSGSPVVSIDPAVAERQTRSVVRSLRLPARVDALRDVPVERMTALAQQVATRFLMRLLRGDEEALMLTPFRAVHDTPLIPEPPARSTSAIPLLTGSVEHETIGFVQAFTGAPVLRPLARAGMRRALRLDASLRAAYSEGPRQLADIDRQLEAAWGDWGFRMPTIRLLENRPGRSWLYEFRWRAQGEQDGSVHGIDLPFSADTLDSVTLLGEEASKYFRGAPKQLAASVHRAFVRFITSGDPGWNPYDTQDRATMIFDTESTVLHDPPGAERLAWSAR